MSRQGTLDNNLRPSGIQALAESSQTVAFGVRTQPGLLTRRPLLNGERESLGGVSGQGANGPGATATGRERGHVGPLAVSRCGTTGKSETPRALALGVLR
jgi:hypothetical protein